MQQFPASDFPFVACIQAHYAGKPDMLGSGCLISSNVILTAGHVVFAGATRGNNPADGYTVTLGSQRRVLTTTESRTNTHWLSLSRTPRSPATLRSLSLAASDFGVIILDDHVDDVPVARLVTPTETALTQTELNVAGYSVEEPQFSSTVHHARIKATQMPTESFRVTYTSFATGQRIMTTGGNSGGPVWANVSGDRRIFAIHTSLFPDRGNGLVISDPIISLVNTWINDFRLRAA